MLLHVSEPEAPATVAPAAPSSPSPSPSPSSSFDAFYAAHGAGLVRQLHAMTGDLAEAQDCVQDAFARAWQRWSRVQSYDAPEAWVRQVAWRLAVSRFRRARTGLSAARRHGPPPDVPALSADRVALLAALGELPGTQRQAVVLHHVAGLSVQEIADQTGAPVGTVKARLFRGRAALAAALTDPEDLP